MVDKSHTYDPCLITLFRMTDDKLYVENILFNKSMELSEMFCNSKYYENILDVFLRFCTASPDLARAVSTGNLIHSLITRSTHHKAIVRLQLLKIVASLLHAASNPTQLIQYYKIEQHLTKIAAIDDSVLVAQLASDLLGKIKLNHFSSSLPQSPNASSNSSKNSFRSAVANLFSFIASPPHDAK